MRKVEIRTAPALRVVGVEHRGPYPEIGRAFERLHALAGERGLHGPDRRLVAVYFDEGTTVPPRDRRALAALTVPAGTSVSPPLAEWELATGEYAVLRHVGPYAGLGATYEWLLRTWLPGSGRRAAGRPCYEIYANTPVDVAPDALITDIHLPFAPVA